jgi:hypothetical protein
MLQHKFDKILASFIVFTQQNESAARQRRRWFEMEILCLGHATSGEAGAPGARAVRVLG